MKRLICEMCGGNDILKQDGVFVCQTCGCKYSLEEAQKMIVEGTVDVKGIVSIDNSALIGNYLELSQAAYNGGNGQSAYDYANKALEIVPQNVDAWIAKMKSIEYLGTFGSLRLVEVMEAGKNAVACAEDEEKQSIALTVYQYQLNRVIALMDLVRAKMSDTADIYQTFQNFAMISVFSASQNTLHADSGMVQLYDNVANEALTMALCVPDDVVAESEELIDLVRKTALAYSNVTQALNARYKSYGTELSIAARGIRRSNQATLEDKANRTQKLHEELVRQRVQQYWANHAEERAALEAERTELDSRIKHASTKANLISLNREIVALDEQIRDLELEIAGIGVFRGKEKRRIQEKMDRVLMSHKNALKKRLNTERQLDEEIAPLRARIRDIDKELQQGH